MPASAELGEEFCLVFGVHIYSQGPLFLYPKSRVSGTVRVRMRRVTSSRPSFKEGPPGPSLVRHVSRALIAKTAFASEIRRA